jgi:phosphoglycolate phosphatase-like HAD superfamily hydrolase
MRALIFDLDGTLVDTVYAHVFAWQVALAEAGMPLEGWRIHRRVGMSGGLFTRAVARELGHALTPEQMRFLQDRHGEVFRSLLPGRRPLCYAVGDSVWDLLAARRAHMFGVGVLTGGYGHDELLAAGAYQVYRDAAELDAALDELGVLP